MASSEAKCLQQDAELLANNSEAEVMESLAEDAPVRNWKRRALLIAVPAAAGLVGLAVCAGLGETRHAAPEASSLVAADGETEVVELAATPDTCGNYFCGNYNGAILANRVPYDANQVCYLINPADPTKTQQCQSVCCRGECSQLNCPQNWCAKLNQPKYFTVKTADEQCCYDPTATCGTAPIAATDACMNCESLKDYCEGVAGVPQTDPNYAKRVADEVAAGNLKPGCELPEDVIGNVKDCKLNLEVIFQGHKTDESVGVNTLDVSTNALTVFSGGDDRNIREWNAYTGKEGFTFTGHRSAVEKVSLFNDAAYFCSASADRVNIYRIHIHVGAILATSLTAANDPDVAGGKFTSCSLLNTWHTVIVGLDNGYILLWTWGTFIPTTMRVPVDIREVMKKNLGVETAYYMGWKRDPQAKADYTQKMKDFYHLDDPLTRRLRGNAQLPNATGEERPLLLRQLASGGTSSQSMPFINRITNYDWGNHPSHFEPPHAATWGAVTSLTFDAAETIFIAGYESGYIRTWRTTDGTKVKVMVPVVINTIKAHDGPVTALASMPAGNDFFSGGADGFIAKWNVFKTKPVMDPINVNFAGAVKSLAMVPGGLNYYSGHENGFIYKWSTTSKKPICVEETDGGAVNGLTTNPGNVDQVLCALEEGDARTYSGGASAR